MFIRELSGSYFFHRDLGLVILVGRLYRTAQHMKVGFQYSPLFLDEVSGPGPEAGFDLLWFRAKGQGFIEGEGPTGTAFHGECLGGGGDAFQQPFLPSGPREKVHERAAVNSFMSS